MRRLAKLGRGFADAAHMHDDNMAPSMVFARLDKALSCKLVASAVKRPSIEDAQVHSENQVAFQN